MFHMQAQNLSSTDIDHYIKLINDLEPYYTFNATTDMLESFSLPFYGHGAHLLQLTPAGSSNPFDALYYIATAQGNLFSLDGQIASLYQANLACDIDLNTENISDYLTYYLFFTALERGQQFSTPKIQEITHQELSDTYHLIYQAGKVTITHQGQVIET